MPPSSSPPTPTPAIVREPASERAHVCALAPSAGRPIAPAEPAAAAPAAASGDDDDDDDDVDGSGDALRGAITALHLDDYAARDVFEAFMEHVRRPGPRGGDAGASASASRSLPVIDRAGFQRVCHLLATLGGPDAARNDATFTRGVLRLFEALDLNGDGVVSVAELMAGLVVLMPGAAGHKVQTVFEAFDVNGDGAMWRAMAMECR